MLYELNQSFYPSDTLRKSASITLVLNHNNFINAPIKHL